MLHLCGASISLVEGKGGLMTAEQVKKAIRKAEGSGSHYPDGTLVCVENTSNLGGGACYSQDALDEIAAVAKENDALPTLMVLEYSTHPLQRV